MSRRYQEGFVNGCRKGRADCEPEIERLRAALKAVVECDDQYDLHAYDYLHYYDEITKVMNQARAALSEKATSA